MKILRILLFTSFVISIASCKKEFSLENANIVAAAGTWKFEEGSSQYNGNVDSSFIRDNAGGTKVLTITGKSLSGGENFLITLNNEDSFEVGSYDASLSEAIFEYFTSTKTIYEADYLTGNFTVNITSLSNNSITGTFSGEVTDSVGGTKNITLGEFTSSINLSNNHASLAEGTLGAVADSCTPVTLNGIYEQGIAFTTSNTIDIEVNITKAGSYAIATNSVNGVNFITTGKFTSTGVQTVTLQGDGTPISGGPQTFIITFGNSHCNFSIDFLFDYFPTTLNSNWSFGLEGGTTDDSASLTVINYNPVFVGRTYNSFIADDIPPSGFPDTFYFRKSNGDYFEYFNAANYFLFDNPVFEEYEFLTENLPVFSTFTSPTFNGTYSGLPASGYIQGTILAKGVSAMVGSKPFSDVIKVQYDFYSSVIPGTSLVTVERWYARGVGLVYQNDSVDALDVGGYYIAP